LNTYKLFVNCTSIKTKKRKKRIKRGKETVLWGSSKTQVRFGIHTGFCLTKTGKDDKTYYKFNFSLFKINIGRGSNAINSGWGSWFAKFSLSSSTWQHCRTQFPLLDPCSFKEIWSSNNTHFFQLLMTKNKRRRRTININYISLYCISFLWWP
jgi:hypothetical protein